MIAFVKLIKLKESRDEDEFASLQEEVFKKDANPRFQLEFLKFALESSMYIESMNQIAISLVKYYPKEALEFLYQCVNDPFSYLEYFSDSTLEFEEWLQVYGFLENKPFEHCQLVDDPLFSALLDKSLELKNPILVKFCFLSRTVALKAMNTIENMEYSDFKVNLLCEICFFWPEFQNDLILPNSWSLVHVCGFSRLLLHGLLHDPEKLIVEFVKLLFSTAKDILKECLEDFFGQYSARHGIDIANAVILHFVTNWESQDLSNPSFLKQIKYLVQFIKKEGIPTIIEAISETISNDLDESSIKTILIK